ncbi:MAG: hypothetical protein ACI4RT_09330 [Candidatus Spyradenecus sp.]
MATVQSGTLTLRTEDTYALPRTFHLTATEARFAIGDTERDRWPVTIATPQRFSILLSGTQERKCQSPKLLPPSIPTNAANPEPWRRLIAFATVTLTVSEDFVGEIALGETALLQQGHLTQE